jgi:hypothetical protein
MNTDNVRTDRTADTYSSSRFTAEKHRRRKKDESRCFLCGEMLFPSFPPLLTPCWGRLRRESRLSGCSWIPVPRFPPSRTSFTGMKNEAASYAFFNCPRSESFCAPYASLRPTAVIVIRRCCRAVIRVHQRPSVARQKALNFLSVSISVHLWLLSRLVTSRCLSSILAVPGRLVSFPASSAA